MNREELAGKSREELVTIAKKLNINPHHKASEATIIEKIMQQPVAYQDDALKHVAEKPVAPVQHNTEDDIRNVLKPFTDKGLELSFPGDGTWVINMRGRNESGNMQIPLRVIRIKAENVSRGPLRLKSMGTDGTYPNSYTDHILAG